MRVAVFIVGPESSGTRMLTQAFVAAGFYGDGGHRQRLDQEGFRHAPDRIAFRRSVPHGQAMPRIGRLIDRLEKAGYLVRPVLIVRDWEMNAQSQVRRKHVDHVDDGRLAVRRAVEYVYHELALAGRTPEVVHYEPFVKHRAVREAFFAGFGLVHPEMEFYDANSKYRDTPK